jgi:hypothetical protein
MPILREVIHNVTQPTILPDSQAIRNDWRPLTTHLGMWPVPLAIKYFSDTREFTGLRDVL